MVCLAFRNESISDYPTVSPKIAGIWISKEPPVAYLGNRGTRGRAPHTPLSHAMALSPNYGHPKTKELTSLTEPPYPPG